MDYPDHIITILTNMVFNFSKPYGSMFGDGQQEQGSHSPIAGISYPLPAWSVNDQPCKTHWAGAVAITSLLNKLSGLA